jgi:hypothetical protein
MISPPSMAAHDAGADGGILGADLFRADHRRLSKLAGSFRAFLSVAAISVPLAR